MKFLSVAVAMTALTFSLATQAETCEERIAAAKAEGEARAAEINANVVKEAEAIKARAEARWAKLEARASAGEIDAKQAEVEFKKLEEKAASEHAAMEKAVQNQYAKLAKKAEKAVKDCT